MSARPTLRGKLPWLALAVLVTVADLVSKELVFTPLREHETRWLAGGWLGLTKVWNDGMMWGALSGWAAVLLPVRVLAALLVLWMVLTTAAGARLLLLSLALVLGGAAGNIYDGIVFGRVRDFILVKFSGVPLFDPFPVFNVADSAICVGVGLLALGLLLDGRHAEQPRAVGDGAGD